MTPLSLFSEPLPAVVRRVLDHPSCLSALKPDSELDSRLVSQIKNATREELLGGELFGSGEMLDLFRGGLLYALDALDSAHAIFQEDSSSYGSYWHGMMHRREGDFSNACYWFSRAGVLREAKEIQQLLESNSFFFSDKWSPEDFTRRCQSAAFSKADTPLETLQAMQKIEFTVLLRRCWRAAVGSSL